MEFFVDRLFNDLGKVERHAEIPSAHRFRRFENGIGDFKIVVGHELAVAFADRGYHNRVLCLKNARLGVE